MHEVKTAILPTPSACYRRLRKVYYGLDRRLSLKTVSCPHCYDLKASCAEYLRFADRRKRPALRSRAKITEPCNYGFKRIHSVGTLPCLHRDSASPVYADHKTDTGSIQCLLQSDRIEFPRERDELQSPYRTWGIPVGTCLRTVHPIRS